MASSSHREREREKDSNMHARVPGRKPREREKKTKERKKPKKKKREDNKNHPTDKPTRKEQTHLPPEPKAYPFSFTSDINRLSTPDETGTFHRRPTPPGQNHGGWNLCPKNRYSNHTEKSSEAYLVGSKKSSRTNLKLDRTLI